MKIVDCKDVGYDTQVTIETDGGRFFKVNIPDGCWSDSDDPEPHGLNLVFGCGEHYT